MKLSDPYLSRQVEEYGWAKQLGADLSGLTTTSTRRARVRAAIVGQGLAESQAMPGGARPETNRQRFARMYGVELDTSETAFADGGADA